MDMLHKNLHTFYDFWFLTLPWLPCWPKLLVLWLLWWSQLPVFLGCYSYAYVPETLCSVDGSHLHILNSLLSCLALTSYDPYNNLNVILNAVHSMQWEYVLFTKPTAVFPSCTENYIMRYRDRSIADQDQFYTSVCRCESYISIPNRQTLTYTWTILLGFTSWDNI